VLTQPSIVSMGNSYVLLQSACLQPCFLQRGRCPSSPPIIPSCCALQVCLQHACSLFCHSIVFCGCTCNTELLCTARHTAQRMRRLQHRGLRHPSYSQRIDELTATRSVSASIRPYIEYEPQDTSTFPEGAVASEQFFPFAFALGLIMLAL
jgi:hypothetical protein